MISLDAYESIWREHERALQWNCLFVLPFWLRAVCRLDGEGHAAILRVADGQRILGLAPLVIEDGCAHFLGPASVCDYQDIVAAQGCETAVLRSVCNHLGTLGVSRMRLRTLRPDAAVLRAARQLADDGMLKVKLEPDEVSYETALPPTWDGYLAQLDGKQRHEVRRKMRRLDSAGAMDVRLSVDGDHRLEAAIDGFIALFRLNREDKAAFMTASMEVYFRELIRALAGNGMLRLFFLDIEGRPAASALCFDYRGVRYLYNCGYDDRYRELSVGVLIKLLSIQNGIEAGLSGYDFLKGEEIYKKRIGGRQVPLTCCDIEF